MGVSKPTIFNRTLKLLFIVHIALFYFQANLPSYRVFASEAPLSKKEAEIIFSEWLKQVIAASDIEISTPLVKLDMGDRLLPEDIEVLKRWLDKEQAQLEKTGIELERLEKMLNDAEQRLGQPLSLSSVSYFRSNYGQSKSFNVTHELFLRANPSQSLSLYSKISTVHNVGQWSGRSPDLHELTISVRFPQVSTSAGWIAFRYGPLLMQRRVDKRDENQDPSRGFHGLRLTGRQQNINWTCAFIPLSLGKGVNYDRYLTFSNLSLDLTGNRRGSLFYLREFADLCSAPIRNVTAASNIIYAITFDGNWALLGRDLKTNGLVVYNEYDPEILKEPDAKQAFVYELRAETKFSNGKITFHSRRIDPDYQNPYSLVRDIGDVDTYIYRYEEPEYSWEEEPYYRNWQEYTIGLRELKLARVLNLSFEMRSIREIRPSIKGLPRRYGHLALQVDSTVFKHLKCSALTKNYFTKRNDDPATLDDDPVAVDCLQREIAFTYGPLQLGLRYLWTSGINKLQTMRQFNREMWLKFNKRLGAVDVELNLKQAGSTELEMYLRRPLTDRLSMTVRQDVIWKDANTNQHLYALMTARF